jgi:hypothetical protein
MSEKFENVVIVRLYEYLEPIDRGERYEDPLNERLQAEDLGEVTGGGSQMDENFKIKFVDLEVNLKDCDGSLSKLIAYLEDLGAPKGSEILFERDGTEQKIEFGRTEGLALILDAKLPAELWEKHVDEVWPGLQALLSKDGVGELHGTYANEEVTEVYIYGRSRERIAEALSLFRETFPLCKNSRLENLNG